MNPPHRMTEAQQLLAADAGMLMVADRIARSFARRHPSLYEEFASAANYGLCLAALRTDGSGEFRSYASDHIRAQILKAYRRERFKGCRRSKGRSPVRRPIDPDTAVARDETPDPFTFEEMLAPLPSAQRRVLRHCYRDGMNQVEVGRTLGIPSRTVWQLHEEALARLDGRFEDRLAAGRAIREARTAMGFTQASLATAIGKSLSYVKQLEAGSLVPTERMAGVIAGCLGRRTAGDDARRAGIPAAGGRAGP